MEYAAAAGANGQAHADLFLRSRRPREQKVCQVAARNEQHQSCGGHQTHRGVVKSLRVYEKPFDPGKTFIQDLRNSSRS